MSTRKTWLALPLGFVAIIASAAAFCLVLTMMGINLLPGAKAEPAPEPAKPIIPTAQIKNSPAWETLGAALANPPAGWQVTGNPNTSPQLPYPYSCASDGINPSVGMLQQYTVSGSPIQVLSTVYGAGTSTIGLKARFDKARSCAGNDAAYGLTPVTGLGVEAYLISVRKTGLNVRYVIWRYGDVVNYLIADANQGNAFSLAQAYDASLMARLKPVCVNADISTADLGRTPFSGAAYTGLIVSQAVTVPAASLPQIPKAEAATYTPVALPGPAIELAEANLPNVPSGYPVWPPLPTPVVKPAVPTAPAATPLTSKDISILADDTQGPGCGWAFTGMVKPNFDAAAAEKDEKAKTAATKAELEAIGKTWQTSVLTYWKEYGAAKTAAPAWNAYAASVNSTADAWAGITAQWDTYRANKKIYDNAVAARDAFLKNQSDEQKRFDGLVAQCKAIEEAEKNKPTPSPTPTPTPNPSATTSPTPTPTPSPTPTIQCPPDRPAILDQQPPSVPPLPSTPPDPRPVDQRG